MTIRDAARGSRAVATVLLVLLSTACGGAGGGGDGGPPSPAAIRVAPAALDFGSPRRGETIARTLTLSNVGGTPLAVSAVERGAGTSAEYAVIAPAGGVLAAIAPGASVTVEVRYTPVAVAARTGSLLVRSNDGARPELAVALSSSITGLSEIAVLATPDADPAAADARAHGFGAVGLDAAQDATVYVLDRGSGNAPLTISDVAVEPADAPFAVVPLSLPAVLQPARVCNRDEATCAAGETCSRASEPAPAVGHCQDAAGNPVDALAVTVRFAPGASAGPVSATLRIANDEGDAARDSAEAPAYAVALTGTGVLAGCVPSGAEICNGADDDCDGLEDELPDVDAACAAALGGAASCFHPGTAQASCGPTPDGCPSGFHDLDGSAANGCEYRCTLLPGLDEPDDDFADTNCDGVDGDVARAVFVAPPPLGDDAAPGTRTAPVATLEAAARLAAAQNADLYLAAGAFDSPATFLVPQGSSVFGGFAIDGPLGPFTGARDGLATIRGPSTALRAEGSTGIVLDRLVVVAADATLASAPAVALEVSSSTLTLNRVELLAGRGAPGAAGSTTSAPAAPGAPGAAASTRIGGLGGPLATAGGRGGDGGLGFAAGSGGAQGSGAAAGGSGGGPSCAGVPGEGGSAGAAGAAGAGSAGLGSVIGLFTGGSWAPASAAAAAPGAHGGGGGGGGGSGGTGTVANGCASATPANGGGGGGGGGGGSGGAGGGGGRQGGASFGVLAHGSFITVRESTIQVGEGGSGGAGGLGQPGGPGGPGGSGAVGAGGAVGGRGGRGGDGGAGGNGGCGAGGPSVGLVAVPDPVAPTLFFREGAVTVLLPAAPAPGGSGACEAGGPGLVLETFF